MALFKISKKVPEMLLIAANFLSGALYAYDNDFSRLTKGWYVFGVIFMVLFLIASMRKGSLWRYFQIFLILLLSSAMWYFINAQAVSENNNEVIMYFFVALLFGAAFAICICDFIDYDLLGKSPDFVEEKIPEE